MTALATRSVQPALSGIEEMLHPKPRPMPRRAPVPDARIAEIVFPQDASAPIRSTTSSYVVPDQSGLDPDTVDFTDQLLEYADRVGIPMEQMRRALAEPRWVNRVLSQPDPKSQEDERLRYCGAGVAVVVEGTTAIAVIIDDEAKGPCHTKKAKR